MTNTKKQFFKSNFYFFTDADIDVSTFEDLFKQNYSKLKMKLYVNDCKNDDTKLSYNLYISDRIDKDMFNSIVDFIFNFTNKKFNIFYKHLDSPNSDKKYEYSYIIKVEKKKPEKYLFIDEE